MTSGGGGGGDVRSNLKEEAQVKKVTGHGHMHGAPEAAIDAYFSVLCTVGAK